MKPQLVDFSQLKKSSITPKLILNETKIINKSIKPLFKEIPDLKQDNIVPILLNLIFVIIIFIGLYLLYKRYKKKDENKINYNKKIENLYNTINKY
tara:strand:+ start:45 stop:332 length:288 start_codon:yes stop_codon:yes gene_type:complete